MRRSPFGVPGFTSWAWRISVISATCESPALDIIHLLLRRGAVVSYSDPYVPKIAADGLELCAAELLPAVEQADCVVIVTDHSDIDYAAMVERSRLIFDARNALKGMGSPKIIKL